MFNLTNTETMEREMGALMEITVMAGVHALGPVSGGDGGTPLVLLFLRCLDGGGVDELIMEAARRQGSVV
jgi:hypothetical protein